MYNRPRHLPPASTPPSPASGGLEWTAFWHSRYHFRRGRPDWYDSPLSHSTPSIFQLWTQRGVDDIVIILSFGRALVPAWRIHERGDQHASAGYKRTTKKIDSVSGGLGVGYYSPRALCVGPGLSDLALRSGAKWRRRRRLSATWRYDGNNWLSTRVFSCAF